ncbi:DUF21 domain-containing protein At1g55930, chloroplastic-like [Pistacia vera]|uniref:DUF21 domain-containing protein At1g55930, chloroplastic-like n=1 Tax=Pistacia vera TaxID=55513 RepID=UPI001263CCC8|nr:DUF21 domain-containing protein At1g55930, chloroplastic-like [Pistacia vera]
MNLNKMVLAALLGLSAFFGLGRCGNWQKKSLIMVSLKCFAVMLLGFLRLFSLAQHSIYLFSVANIGATALVTEVATALFGEASVSAAIGVMTGPFNWEALNVGFI